jgi:hypothetical protein
MLLCIKFLAPPESKVLLVQGSGILDNIWLWRNRRNCPIVLGHVKQPTEFNLRITGQIAVRLSVVTLMRSHLEEHCVVSSCRNTVVLGQDLNLDQPISPPSAGQQIEYPTQIVSAEQQLAKDHLSSHNFCIHVKKLCILLHILLVLIHLTLLGIKISEWEHKITFPHNLQNTVSFWSSVATSAFGMVCILILTL